MRGPEWATDGKDSFRLRHYELATFTEQTWEQVIEE